MNNYGLDSSRSPAALVPKPETDHEAKEDGCWAEIGLMQAD